MPPRTPAPRWPVGSGPAPSLPPHCDLTPSGAGNSIHSSPPTCLLPSLRGCRVGWPGQLPPGSRPRTTPSPGPRPPDICPGPTGLLLPAGQAVPTPCPPPTCPRPVGLCPHRGPFLSSDPTAAPSPPKPPCARLPAGPWAQEKAKLAESCSPQGALSPSRQRLGQPSRCPVTRHTTARGVPLAEEGEPGQPGPRPGG